MSPDIGDMDIDTDRLLLILCNAVSIQISYTISIILSTSTTVKAEFSCYWLLSLQHKHADIDNVIDINNQEGRILCYWLLLLLHININISIQISIICGLVSAYQKVPKTESYLFLWELLGNCSYHPPREKNRECWKSSVLFFVVPRYSSYISVLLYSKSSTPE
jgi:hypothetical protein